MSKPILALNSIRGKSGKDTLIEHIEATGLKVHRVAFADNLKRECSKVLTGGYQGGSSAVERMMHTSEKDDSAQHLAVDALPHSGYKAWLESAYPDLNWYSPRSLRWHLQQYGSEYVREHMGKPNHWLDQGILDVLNGLSDPSVDLVVVTDLRLPNEYTQLTLMGAVPVRIVRNWHIPEVDTVSYHQSDIALMAHPFDALVVNEWGKPEDMLTSIKEYLP